MSRRRQVAGAMICALAAAGVGAPAWAQMHGGAASEAAPHGPPVDDQHVWFHAILEQFEYRAHDEGALSWDGQAWLGTDSNRLWLKTEGELQGGSVEGGKHELLYDRPISTYFDLQAGFRFDADSKPGRGWAAIGVQGLAPYFFEVSATAYAGEKGRLAANFEGSFDLLLTQRLILQPTLEFNLYSKRDAARRTGSGLADVETGLRLRYEISRKFAPYAGLSYQRSYGQTRRYDLADGEDPETFVFAAGVRSWF